MIQRIALGTCAVVATVALACAPAMAQDIDDLDEGVALETPFERGIEPNVWELGIQIGYIDFSSTLLAADGIIVDLENPQDAIFADMELHGDSSFQPLLRINRNIGSHIEFVNSIGFAIGDYTQKITGPQEKWKARDSVNELTAVELQTGSYFMWRHEHGISYYPRGKGMVQPFVTAGVGTNHFSLDSDYVSGTAGNLAFSWGAGLRVVADDLFSLTFEVRNYHTKAQFDVANTYKTIPNLSADGLVDFPTAALEDIDNLTDAEIVQIVDRLGLRESFGFGPNTTGAEMRVDFLDSTNELPRSLPKGIENFDEQSYSSLWFSFGFTAAF